MITSLPGSLLVKIGLVGLKFVGCIHSGKSAQGDIGKMPSQEVR